MKKRWFLLIPVVALLSLALFAAACGDDDENGDGGETPAATQETATEEATQPADETPGATDGSADNEGTTVDISLTDSPFAVTADPASAPAGSVTFNVTNDGTIEHEFKIIDTDLAADALPINADEFIADETQLDVVDEIPTAELQSSDSASITVDLAIGHYALICNVPSHYESGTFADFEVQ